MVSPSSDTPSARVTGQVSYRRPGRPFLVALEGPPLAGKSTLASRLAAADPAALVFPDYYDGVPTERRPAFDPGSTEAQVRAIREFLAVETGRLGLLRGAPSGTCILDRSVESLRAHSHALDMIQGYSSRAALEKELSTTEHLVPDLILYLDAPAQVLEERLSTRVNSQELLQYLDHRFLSCIREHFRILAQARPGVHLLDISDYLDQIPAAVSSILPERGTDH